MSNSVTETLVGAAVLVIGGVFLVYAANTADVSATGDGYSVFAKFRKAEGLNTGADVRIAGVKVGSVNDMELDTETYFASVEISLREEVRLPEDSSAKITSASLLGDNFVAIEPGGSEFMLEEGGEIPYTQGSVSLGDLIGKVIQGGAGLGD